MSNNHLNQLLITGREKVGIKKLKYPKAFIEFPQIIDDVYKNLQDYNPTKKSVKIFDDIIAWKLLKIKSHSHWTIPQTKRGKLFYCAST